MLRSLLFAFLFYGTCLNLCCAIKDEGPPQLDPSRSNTAEWIEWSQRKLFKQSDMMEVNETIGRAIVFLSALPSSVVLNNQRHFADVQILKSLKRDVLYRYSLDLEKVEAPRSKWLHLLEQMRLAGADDEDLVRVYFFLGDHRSYLASMVRIYESHERDAQQLRRPLILPPQFFNVEDWDLMNCNDGSVLLDISIKKMWWAGVASEKKWLFPLSERYQSLGHDVRAKEVLSLAPAGHRSAELISKLAELQKKTAGDRFDAFDGSELY